MSEQPPLFEVPPTEVPDIDQLATSIGRAADANPITEYEDHTSEAARDQGHGPQERGVPLESEDYPRRKPEAVTAQKEAQAKRRKRRTGRETRYTDIGSDTHDSDPAYMQPEEGTELPKPDPAINALGMQAARRALGPSHARTLARDSDNDARIALALQRARAERRAQQ